MKQYTITFENNKTVIFTHFLQAEVLDNINAVEWEEANINNGKFKQILRNHNNNYLCLWERGDGMILNNIEDLNLILPNEVVLFGEEDGSVLYPFIILDKEKVTYILKNNKTTQLTPNIQSDVFMASNFYKLKDGRVLAVEKSDGTGEIYLSLHGLIKYHEFIEDGPEGVIYFPNEK